MKTNIENLKNTIVYMTWAYSKYSDREREKIKNILLKSKKDLLSIENSESEKLTLFVNDLLEDIENNRELNIDKILEDDFVWNYYNCKKQVASYNKLINKKYYDEIFKTKSMKRISDISDNFMERLKKLDIEFISSRLLIFTIFEYVWPSKYIQRLEELAIKLQDKSAYIQIMLVKSAYLKFLRDLKRTSILNFKNKNIEFKFIKADHKRSEDNFLINLKLQNAARLNERTWNHKHEYFLLLKRL